MRQSRHLWLFASLYMSQFLGIGFLFTALVAILRERGGSLEEVGVINLFVLVWAVKFLWAPLVDKFGSRRLGHYRSWLILTQPATALAIVMITPLDVREDLPLVLLALGCVTLLSATQDIATDALAVRLVKGTGRGAINGLQVGVGFIGDVIGGGLVLVVYEAFGWAPAVITLAVVTALPIVFIARFQENRLAAEPPRERVRMRSLGTLFREPGMVRWAVVVLPVSVIGVSGAYGMLVPIMEDSGMSLSMIGLLSNAVGGGVSVVTALVAGALVTRLGRKRSLVIYCAGEAVAVAAMLPVAWGAGAGWTVTAVVLLNVFNAAAWAVVYTIAMDRSRRDTAGTDFTLQVSILYTARFVAGSVIVTLAGTYGYVTMLIACLVLAVIGVVAVALLYAERPEPRPVPLAADRTTSGRTA